MSSRTDIEERTWADTGAELLTDTEVLAKGAARPWGRGGVTAAVATALLLMATEPQQREAKLRY